MSSESTRAAALSDGTRLATRIGLGTMPLAIAGRPDLERAKAVVRAAVEHGVGLIDTADVYALDDADIGYGERLVAQALREMDVDPERADGGGDAPLLATKGGMTRPEGAWGKNASPEHLRAACHGSLRALNIERIPLYQLHAPDPAVPIEESVGALARLRDEGKIQHVGLSNVGLGELERARTVTPIASVQNAMSVWDLGYRRAPLVDYCAREGVLFLAHSPFGGAGRAPALAEAPALRALGREVGAAPHELALAWLLAVAPCVVPIPGTTRPERPESWLRALEIDLDRDARARLRRALRRLPGQRGILSRILGKLRQAVSP